MKDFEKTDKNNFLNANQMFNKDFYIVMELLKPLVSNNYIISSKLQAEKTSKLEERYRLKKVKITNELGIYGVYLRYNHTKTYKYSCLSNKNISI